MKYIYVAAWLLWGTLANAQQPPTNKELRSRFGPPSSKQDVETIVKAVRAFTGAGKNTEEHAQLESTLSILGRPDAKAKDELEEVYIRLLDDRNLDIQAAAAAGCGKLKSAQAIPKVRVMLSAKIRHHFTKHNLGGASPADIRQTQTLARALADLGDYDSIDEILSREEVMSVSGFGGPIVAAFGARVLPKVVEIAHKNDARRGGALHAISFLNDPAAIPELVKLSRGSDPQIASAALYSLKKLLKGAPGRASEIESAYKEQLANPDYQVRAAGYVGLLSVDPFKYRTLIEDAIKNDAHVRTDILNALSGEKIPEIVPFLKQFIKNDERRAPKWTADRRLAARAIFRMTGERVQYKGLERDRELHPDPYAP